MAVGVMLVEDDAGVRTLLKKIIERNEGFEVNGECDNLADAVTLFVRNRPEVIFMDIEINGVNGIDCARVIMDMEPKTKIIFATAHAEYMPEAFEVYAYDYLVKPFDIERVEQTLRRIAAMKEEHSETELSEKKVHCERGLDRLLVKGRESMIFVDIPDIILVQRENNSTVICTAQDSFTTSAGLHEIEVRLDPEHFMRSHKSYITNLSKIRKIEPYGRWTYIVTFRDTDRDALITAEKDEELKKRFS